MKAACCQWKAGIDLKRRHPGVAKGRDDPTGADQDSPSLISVKVGDEQEGIGDTIYLQFSVESCMGTRGVRHS